MIETCVALYEDIASEYYDEIRHPTCANFREASAFVLKGWLQSIDQIGWACEVGAGKSLTAELLNSFQSESNLIITDSSPSMLSYSSQWAGPNITLLLCDALALPFASGELDLVVSSLGDPYNVPEFWREACRVLRPGGKVLFTTPAHDWAASYRHRRNSLTTLAEFEVWSGGSLLVPSWIYKRPEQEQMIEQAGLCVEEYVQVPLSALKSTPISPKLLPERGNHSAVVEGYLVTKPSQ